MTHHLSPEELIDSLERPLPPAREQHAEACGVCRAERTRLGELVRDVSAVDVPEPSPLFWDHLSARIRERIAREPVPATRHGWIATWLSGGWWPRWVMAGAVLALCAALGWMTIVARRGPSAFPRLATEVAHNATSATDPELAPFLDTMDDEWAVMVSVAEHVSWDDDADSASMFVRPTTVEHALNDLSEDERQALVELLRAEMARPPS